MRCDPTSINGCTLNYVEYANLCPLFRAVKMLICMQIFEISVFGGTDNERVDGILTGEPELMRLAMTLAKNKKKKKSSTF